MAAPADLPAPEPPGPSEELVQCEPCEDDNPRASPTLAPTSLPRSASNRVLMPPAMSLAAAEAAAAPPVTRQALVLAAARITTTDSFVNPQQLIRVDGAPVIMCLSNRARECHRALH